MYVVNVFLFLILQLLDVLVVLLQGAADSDSEKLMNCFSHYNLLKKLDIFLLNIYYTFNNQSDQN